MLCDNRCMVWSRSSTLGLEYCRSLRGPQLKDLDGDCVVLRFASPWLAASLRSHSDSYYYSFTTLKLVRCPQFSLAGELPQRISGFCCRDLRAHKAQDRSSGRRNRPRSRPSSISSTFCSNNGTVGHAHSAASISSSREHKCA